METMRRQRRNHSPEFKARVALEALKGIKPIHEIAVENDIHPLHVSQWKKRLQERIDEPFERKNARDHKAEAEQRLCNSTDSPPEWIRHRGQARLTGRILTINQ